MRITPLFAFVIAFAAACGTKPNKTDTAVAGGSVGAAIADHAADSIGNSGIPKAVADVGTHGENLYDQAKANDWAKAQISLDSLDLAAKALSASEASEIRGVLDTLHTAVAAKQRETAIEAANRVTFLGAKFTEKYHPKMPADIVRLDYYGRELEIWAAQKNTAKLKATAAELTRTWEAVKPTVVSAGAAAAAATTDSLVAQLGKAKSPADYAKLATPILNVVDELEKPFEK
jgi:hypothetical protein